MSKATRDFFEALKGMVGDGLKNLVPDILAEAKRLGTHGAVELGQALFNGGVHPIWTGPTRRTPRKWV